MITYNRLITFIFVTRYLDQPHTTAQIPRHTGLLPGQFLRPIGTIDWPVAAPLTKPTTTAVPLAVKMGCVYLDFQRTSKSLATRPCNRPGAAKHMLFYLPGLDHLDSSAIPKPGLFSSMTLLSRQPFHDKKIPAFLPRPQYKLSHNPYVNANTSKL